MRFVFVISELSKNGPSGSRLRLAAGLRRRGHAVTVLALTNHADTGALAIPPGVDVQTIAPSLLRYPAGLFGRVRLALRLRAWVQRQVPPIDFLSSSLTSTDRIVHMAGLQDAWHWIHIATSQLLTDARSARRRKRRLAFFRRLYRGRHVIGVSQGVLDDLEGIDATPAEARLLYNAFDVEAVRALAEQPAAALPHESFLLHVGRFAPAKRHDLLFRAMIESGRPEKLVLLTDPSEALSRLIAEYGLSDRVAVAGFQANPYPFMRAATASVLSSDREGFPNALVESLICGTPVISTDCLAGPSEILSGPHVAYLSPPGDAAALAVNIKKILEDPYPVGPEMIERFSLEKALDDLEAMAEAGPPPRLGPVRIRI
jgi:glycosyltransferase involved in cell wall biosynthesis